MDTVRWAIIIPAIIFFVFMVWLVLTGRVTNSKRRTVDDLDIPKKKLSKHKKQKN